MSSLTRHDNPVDRELRHLEQVADVGESAETPAILIGGVALVAAMVVIVILALTLIIARLVT